MTKLQEKSPLVILTCWSLNIARDLEPQGQKGSEITKFEMANEKNIRMEQIENGQQTRDAREDCPNNENGDELVKRERDY